ncbi:MAG: sigma 54-interacting transcriptional regulator [Syntrophomonadaceae bacterium]|nr:sigma 54-interacting transcriptional regulator [Syntrophomonadaceae bacterium]
MGIDPYRGCRQPLPSRDLEYKQNLISRVIQSAKPVMQDIFKIPKKCFVALSDIDGCIVEVLGNSRYVLEIGLVCSEQAIGTNTIGTVLLENMSLELNGYEHYSTCCHSYRAITVPIHDDHNKIIAALNLTAPLGTLPDWAIDLIHLGVKVIESQLLYKSEQAQLNVLRNSITTVIDLIKESLLLVDDKGTIIHASVRTLNLLGFNHHDDIIGKNITEFLPKSLCELGRLDNHFFHPPSKFYILGHDQTALPCEIIHQQSFGFGNDRHDIQLVSIKNKPDHAPEHKPSFLDNLVGVNPIWTEIKNTITKAAAYSSNVLIEGETGTVKEMVAQAIHNESRRNGRFIAINCGAIPANLVHSELFGYEEGSFTGARKGGYKGKFEMAEEGTLFLDEIGEMPLDMQVILLRFLQDKTINRIGSNRSKKIDIRIIAATNRNLINEIKNGSFREDLYYRLNVINIKIPPLRERKDDIPVIACSLLKDISHQLHREPHTISIEAMKMLCEYNWPGNVRELHNVIESALILNNGTTIIPSHLPPHISRANHSIATNNTQAVEFYEKDRISATIARSKGNISKAARSLGISRVTLYRKIKKWNINPRQFL